MGHPVHSRHGLLSNPHCVIFSYAASSSRHFSSLQEHRVSGRSKASSRKSRLSQKERVAISDLSSWGSDDDDGSEKAAEKAEAVDQRESPKVGMKHSKGIMDLSKFLRSDDENDNDAGEDAVDGASRARKIEGLSVMSSRFCNTSEISLCSQP